MTTSETRHTIGVKTVPSANLVVTYWVELVDGDWLLYRQDNWADSKPEKASMAMLKTARLTPAYHEIMTSIQSRQKKIPFKVNHPNKS